MRGKKENRKERGIELLEFALLVPFLLLLVGGAVEFGRAFYTYHILSKAVRDGARYLATSRMSFTGTLDTNAQSRTRNLVVYGTIDTTGPRILPDLLVSHVNIPTPTSVSPTEQYVTVGVNYPYSPFFSFIMPITLTLRPSVTMQFLGSVTFGS